MYPLRISGHQKGALFLIWEDKTMKPEKIEKLKRRNLKYLWIDNTEVKPIGETDMVWTRDMEGVVHVYQLVD